MSTRRRQETARRAELTQTAERYAARIPGLAPQTWDTRHAAGPGWALLGDAAGFADPVTGEGIYYALRSAELWAEAYLAGTPERYEAQWRADFMPYGGFKESGYGKEGPKYALQEMTETKMVVIHGLS